MKRRHCMVSPDDLIQCQEVFDGEQSMNSEPRVGSIGWMFGAAIALAMGFGTCSGQEPVERPHAGLSVWDTGTSSSQQLSPRAIEQRKGWKPVALGETNAAFQGDAVIANGRLLAVARQQGIGIELYSLGSGKPVYRARLVLVGDKKNDRIGVTENSRGAINLEVTSEAGAARFRLKKGEQFIEVQDGTAAGMLRLECPSRFALLPDFFADDILFDARKVPVDKIELPSENFLLHFTGKQDAVVMAVFENRAQDVRVTLAGQGVERAITGSEIEFGKKGSKIWIAVLEGVGMWHAVDV